MAKRSLGRHWAGRTLEEQREFVKVFAALMGNSYADNIETYSTQNVLYIREREDRNYAQVDTKIVAETRSPLSINYKLHSVDREWKIYDLVIEDISMVGPIPLESACWNNRTARKCSVGKRWPESLATASTPRCLETQVLAAPLLKTVPFRAASCSHK
jgi:hypothetical protein